MAVLPVYEGVLKLGRELHGLDGISLDIGACCESCEISSPTTISGKLIVSNQSVLDMRMPSVV